MFDLGNLSAQAIINIFLIGGLIISYLSYKIVCAMHKKDPNYKAKEEERLRDLKRQQRDNDSLDDYIAQDDSYDE